MKKTIKLIELIFCFLLFVTVLPIAADETAESVKEDISLAQNESREVKVDKAVSWKIKDPHAADEHKRQLLIEKGDTLTIKYSLAQNMLEEKTAVFFACNENGALLKEYRVTFTDALHEEKAFVPQEKAGGHQKVEPPCGYEVMLNGDVKPFPGSVEGFIATKDYDEAYAYLDKLTESEFKYLRAEVLKDKNNGKLKDYHIKALVAKGIQVSKQNSVKPMMLKAAGEPIRLEVVYHYQDENGQIVNEGGNPKPIAPGWYLDDPDNNEPSYKVTFHVIQGYLPYIQNADGQLSEESISEYEFKPENGAYASKTVTVVYVPQEVSYTVELYKEKLDGTYTEETLTGEHKAKTGSQIDMDTLCGTIHEDGFTAPYYHEVPRVMGDGSTVAKIYLDRAYFLMDFDLGEGGYGVEPIYKKFGDSVSVGTPIRAGYTFTGWQEVDENGNNIGNVTNVLPTAMPAKNTKYIAQWTPAGDTKYSIVYWYENADDNNYSVAGTGFGTGTVGNIVTRESHKGDSFTGRDNTHFTYNPDKGEDVTIKGDGTTVLNVYYTRNVYTLTFYVRVNYWSSEQIYTISAKYNAYIGDKWAFTGNNGVDYPQTNPATSWTPSGSDTYTERLTHMERMPDENISFTHTTTSNVGRQFYYYVEALDGTVGERDFDGKQFNLYLALPNDFNIIYYNEDFFLLEGFTRYKAATENGTEVTISTNGTRWDSDWNNTLYFYYTRDSYKLKFMNGSEELNDLTKNVPYEKKLESYKPADLQNTPSGLEPGAYVFDGWSVSSVIDDSTRMTDDMWANDTMPAADRILYARWIPVNHNVTFRNDVGDEIPTDKITVPHGSLIPENNIPEDPTKAGFDFVGWFYQVKNEQGQITEHAFKPDQMPVRSDMDLYAKWKSTTQYKYTVYYVLESDHNVMVAEPTVGIGEPNDSFTVNAKKGYSQDHPSELFWEYWQFFMPTKDSETFTLDEYNKVITFCYKEETATITYIPVTAEQGSVTPTTETIGKVTGEPQGSIPTPVTNYKFVGWYTDETCTQPVPESWVDADNKLTPQRTYDAGVPTAGTSTLWVFENKTYYAKFELDVADLTVTKTVTDGKVYSDDDIFIFTITGPDNLSMELTIKASELVDGRKSVTIHGLKVGEYTVTEDTNWSWRYECTSNTTQTVTLQANGTNEAVFTNTLTNEHWLSASAQAINEYGKGGNQE